MSGRVLIIHFRVGRTDGVSIEIASWKEVLEKHGFKVLLAGGSESVGADFVIPGLENQMEKEGYLLDSEAFGGFKKLKEDEFVKRFVYKQKRLEKEFQKLFSKAKPDRVIVSNVFSVGENLAVAGTLAAVLAKTKIPAVCINHDFYWENPRYKKPSCKLVEEQLKKFFPPKLPNFKYLCINSIARRKLARRKSIVAGILYDTMDFSQKAPGVSLKCKRALGGSGINKKDLVILQATRIVRRKNIEIAMDFVKRLSLVIGKIQLYDGRKFNPAENRVLFVMSGYAERRDEGYLEKLIKYAKRLGINLIRIDGVVAGNGNEKSKNHCSLLEVYPMADLITYPSEYEGFGNQFLEGLYHKKPVAVFEYPVFKSDIKPLGFDVVSFGDKAKEKSDGLISINTKTMDQTVTDAVSVLTSTKRYQEMVNKNFKLARDNFSYENAWRVFEKVLR